MKNWKRTGLEKAICRRCEIEKMADEFGPQRNNGRVYRSPYCKPCRVALVAERRKANPSARSGQEKIARQQGRMSSEVERTRRWRQRHPEQRAIQNQLARARRKKAKGSHTANEWNARVEEFGGACAYCLVQLVELTRDHMKPLIQGGSHSIENIVPACRSCNSRKNARNLLQFACDLAC